MSNIAGANIPVFRDVKYREMDYDLYMTSFWLDQGILELREFMTLLIEMDVIIKQIEILSREFRVTTQRVNLFEKVKIPECVENIRKVRIHLGDQMANAVGISKVAKKKIELSTLPEEVLV
jgi:V/A-type H+-transporting ATPase subunit D